MSSEKVLLCYSICQSLLAFRYLYGFCQIPALYTKFFAFYTNIFHLSSTIQETNMDRPQWISSSPWPRIARAMREWGREGLCRWWKILRRCDPRIILTRDLLCQAQDRSRITFWFLVPQGTEETSSADNEGVQHRNRDCDTAVDPTTYVWKGSLRFCRHESTQMFEYN